MGSKPLLRVIPVIFPVHGAIAEQHGQHLAVKNHDIFLGKPETSTITWLFGLNDFKSLHEKCVCFSKQPLKTGCLDCSFWALVEA